MADNPGVLISSNISLLGTTTPEWFENYPEYPPVIGAQPASPTLNGLSTDNRPIQFTPVNFPGARVRNYSDIFYNQILIEPSAINSGNIASDVTQSIWSATAVAPEVSDSSNTAV